MADYVVTSVWWPDGWEPTTPLDVPKCLSPVQEQTAGGRMTYQQAVATVRGLNQQNMDHPGTSWFVVAKVKDGRGAGAARRRASTPGGGGRRGGGRGRPRRLLALPGAAPALRHPALRRDWLIFRPGRHAQSGTMRSMVGGQKCACPFGKEKPWRNPPATPRSGRGPRTCFSGVLSEGRFPLSDLPGRGGGGAVREVL